MTRMRAPFSSFSLWLSDFSSVKICRETQTGQGHRWLLRLRPALQGGGTGAAAGCLAWSSSPPTGHSSVQSLLQTLLPVQGSCQPALPWHLRTVWRG